MSFDHLIFDAGKTRPQEAVRALAQFNCIQIKGAVDAEVIRGEFAVIQALGRRFGTVFPPHQIMYRMLDDSDRIDSPLPRLIQTEPIYSILSGYLASPDLVLSTHYASNLRYVTSTPIEEVIARGESQGAEPFHQDSRCCSPDIFGKMVIVWLLLSPQKSGIDFAPSLKLVPSPVGEILPVEKNPIHPWSSGLEISHEQIDKLSSQSGIWIPDVEVGDAIIFSGMCPHGTYVPAVDTPTRFSCEIKVWPNSGLIHDSFLGAPENHSGHMVVNKHFVVGPIAVENAGGNDIAGHSPNLSSNQIDYYKVGFRYGRMEDGRTFRVTNRATAAPRETQDGPIALVETGAHSATYFAQLLRAEQTGRSFLRASETFDLGSRQLGGHIVAGPFALGIPNVQYVGCLRDPMTRVMSDIVAKFQAPSWSGLDEYLDARETLSVLPAIFARTYDRNGGYPKNEPNANDEIFGSEREMLAVALKNIENFFPLVCIEERFAESAFLLFDLFGWKQISLPITAPLPDVHPAKADIPASIVAKIESKIHADRTIYDFCLGRLDARARQVDFGPDFDDFKQGYEDLQSVLSRTSRTLAARAIRRPDVFAATKAAFEQRTESLERLHDAQELELDQLRQKVERMEASYTALLKQHLEALNITTG